MKSKKSADFDISKLENSFVIGLGSTGVSVLNFLKKNNIKNAFFWDDNPHILKSNQYFENYGFKAAKPQDLKITDLDYIFVSPGLDLRKYNLFNNRQDQSICKKKLLNDVQLFCNNLENKSFKLGITGTNGKSTTASMIAKLINDSGLKAFTVGNIGKPVLDCLSSDFFVIELSSFQLEQCNNLNLDIAVLLDITPDHLDRYENIEEYAKAKAKIFENKNAHAIVSVDTKINEKIFGSLTNKKKTAISVNKILDKGFSMLGNKIYKDGNCVLDIKPKFLHSCQNILCAYTCGRLIGVKDEILKPSLESFCGLKHRAEYVAKYKNIVFINDSKATNFHSASHLLKSFNNIYWLAGGSLKKSLSAPKIDLCNIKKAYFFGEAKDILFKLYGEEIVCKKFSKMQDAFLQSFKDANEQSEEVIIALSPCFPSFDQFSNFEERGNCFTDLVFDSIKK